MHRTGVLATRVVGALLLVMLPACEWVTHHVELEYDAPIAPAAPGPVAASAGRADARSIAIAQLSDDRSPQATIGDVRNGYGMHVANVETTGDPVEWLRQGLTAELENAGFNLVEVAERYTIAVALDRLHVSASSEYHGTVRISATVLQGDRRVLAGVYVGTGSAGPSWTANDEALGSTADLALQDAIRQFLRDLRRIAR